MLKILFILAFCIASIAAILPPTRPDSNGEDEAFWREYGSKDLKSKLRLKHNTKKARNVIFFVGDGMGVATHTAARIYKGQKQGQTGEESVLEWEKFPYSGQSKTYNTDFQVPDSAGTATALFSGVKTRMAVLGIDSTPNYNSCQPDILEKSKLKSLLHRAIEDGKATGIVTSTRITHATPAALYSHVQNRDWEADSKIPPEFRGQCQDIASQLVYSEAGQKVNLVFGGGRANFLPKSEGGLREDGVNLINVWKQQKEDMGQNHKVLLNKNDLEAWNQADFALGLFQMSDLKYIVDRDDNVQPSLDFMTSEAIKRLRKNPNGFFLMVEGGMIDKAHHKNWAKKAFEETLELEKAVKAALDLTDEEDTLIIVTADHSHAMTMNGYPARGNNILGYVFNEARELWNGQLEGTKAAWSTISYANGLGFWDHFTQNKSMIWKDIRDLDYNDDQYRSPAMVPTYDEYETHGGEDVPVLANGPWAHLFTGVYEESYICHAVEHAAGWNAETKDYLFGESNSAPSRFSTNFLLLLFSALLLLAGRNT